MADEDENLVVNLDEEEAPPPASAEAGSQVAGKPPPVPGPSAARVAPQQGLAELERQVEAERTERARVTAAARQIAQERDQAIAFAQEAERRGMNVYELNNENELRATNEQLDSIQAQQEAAYNEGDFKTVADLNRAIGRLSSKLEKLEFDKQQLAAHREQMTARAEAARRQPPQQQQPQMPSDPIERALVGRTEPTKAFLRKHPELIRGDGTLKRAAIDAHERALDEGHTVDSQRYFEFLEGVLGPGSNGQAPYRPQGAPTTAAPVARGPGPGSGNGVLRGDGTFVMTPKMRRLAEEQGVDPKEWAKNYVRLLQEGRVTPIT